jgi:hypothetical protein
MLCAPGDNWPIQPTSCSLDAIDDDDNDGNKDRQTMMTTMTPRELKLAAVR